MKTRAAPARRMPLQAVLPTTRQSMSDAIPVPTLPVAESFAAEYLEYYRMLPLEITTECLRVAVAGEPNADALADLRDSYGLALELVPVDDDQLRDAIRQT